ncbi:hypothetical protein I4U23_019893 [Adineta vaga]|nr:hypothetical protein I4U23_019893 [Adineta vaga]
MSNTTMNYSQINDEGQPVNLINLISFLNKTFSQYGLGLIYLMGNIGSALNCIVFYQPTFRKSPCAMYFLASNFFQFFSFNFALLNRMLLYGYDVQVINTYDWFCKIRFYLFYILTANSRYNIIMASIDRYFASSQNVARRRYSSSKVALKIIIISSIIWSLIYIQVLIFYDINDDICQYQSGVYGMIFSIYISIDSGILPILLMVIFGVLTIRNIHQSKRRIGINQASHVEQHIRINHLSRKDMQLYRMLINQLFLFIFLNLPNPCYLIYYSYTINAVRPLIRLTIELFISNMTYVFIYLGFALTFANFLVSSDIFRRELQLFILRKLHQLQIRHGI